MKTYYIVCGETAIWGLGLTEKQAWREAAEYLNPLGHTADWSDDTWVEKCTPALAALVAGGGGDCAWAHNEDGIADIYDDEPIHPNWWKELELYDGVRI